MKSYIYINTLTHLLLTLKLHFPFSANCHFNFFQMFQQANIPFFQENVAFFSCHNATTTLCLVNWCLCNGNTNFWLSRSKPMQISSPSGVECIDKTSAGECWLEWKRLLSLFQSFTFFVCARYNLSCRPASFPVSFQSKELPQNSSKTVALARRPGRSTNCSQILR